MDTLADLGTSRFETVVLHSGGMDSSLCLALASREFGPGSVLSLGFRYGQRHSSELAAAERIAAEFQVRRYVVDVTCYDQLTRSALLDAKIPIRHRPGKPPNTMVVGRNGLMVRLAAILADTLGASRVDVGVIGVEASNSGYRDCTHEYMSLMQAVLRLDLGADDFEIRTPIVDMSKRDTMVLGYELGCLEFLLRETVTCYDGVPLAGCRACPACRLRNLGLREFLDEYSDFSPPFLP